MRTTAGRHSHHTRRSPWFQWAQAGARAGAQKGASSGGEASRGAVNTAGAEKTRGWFEGAGGRYAGGVAGGFVGIGVVVIWLPRLV